jgi:MFS family permease
MPTAGAADVLSSLHLSATAFALAAFTIPQVFAMVVETPLLAWCDRRRELRPKLIALGLLGMAAAMLIEGRAHGAISLAIGVALFFPSTGVASSLAEGALVDENPDDAERAMARWSLLGYAGDIAAPLLLALAGFAFATTSTALVLVVGAALAIFVQSKRSAPLLASGNGPDGPPHQETTTPARVSRTLLTWLFAASLCSLLDETLVALTSLFAHDKFGTKASPELLVAAFSAGGVVGSVVIERVLRARSAMPVLFASCVLCAVSYVAFLIAPNVVVTGVLAFVAGAFIAPLHPLAKAQAYRALPGRSSMVNAIGAVFGVVDALAPVALGLVVDRFGIVPAMFALLAQPIGVGALALIAVLNGDERREEPG